MVVPNSSVYIFDNLQHVGKNLVAFVMEKAKNEIEMKGSFSIAFSGGSLPMIFGKGIEQYEEKIDASQWHVFFADERYVPLESEESNYNACKIHVFSKLNIPENHIYKMKYGIGLEKAAEDYERQFNEYFQHKENAEIDVVLLGIGPDGHTCSLFPDHGLLSETSKSITWLNDSPKPPPERITFTYNVLNKAKQIVFEVLGDDKAQPLSDILSTPSNLPAALVRPTSGNIAWFIDKAAGSNLSSSIKKDAKL